MRRPSLVDLTAAIFALLGVSAVAMYLTFPGTRDWTPNIGTDAFSLAIAISLVDRIVARAEKARRKPRIERAMARLTETMRDLSRQAHGVHHFTHAAANPRLQQALADNFSILAAGLPTEQCQPPTHDGHDDLLRTAADYREYILQVRENYADVLDHDLLQALDDYLQDLSLVDDVHDASEAKRTTERRNEVRQVAYEILAERSIAFVAALERHAPGASRYPATEFERLSRIDESIYGPSPSIS